VIKRERRKGSRKILGMEGGRKERGKENLEEKEKQKINLVTGQCSTLT
jgi:hypothetical protein